MDRSQVLVDTGDLPVSRKAHSVMPSAAEVFHRHRSRVYTMARRMVNSDADADDVTQDVLLQVVRKLPSFRGASAFPTWLHRVTVNAALAHRRKKALRERKRSPDPFDLLMEETPSTAWVGQPDDELLRRETQGLIDQAVAALPSMYRDVFVMSDVEGLPNATIAEVLGLSLPAMKSRLHRARAMLRETLAPHFTTA
jgi:RNA polymerase sigma-70 factor (ECF subfamily)